MDLDNEARRRAKYLPVLARYLDALHAAAQTRDPQLLLLQGLMADVLHNLPAAFVQGSDFDESRHRREELVLCSQLHPRFRAIWEAVLGSPEAVISARRAHNWLPVTGASGSAGQDAACACILERGLVFVRNTWLTADAPFVLFAGRTSLQVELDPASPKFVLDCRFTVSISALLSKCVGALANRAELFDALKPELEAMMRDCSQDYHGWITYFSTCLGE